MAAKSQKPIEAYALRLSQHQKDIYLFSLSAKDLIEIVEVIPNTQTHPDYPQREINDARCRAIADYICGAEKGPRQSKLGYLPPSLVLNLYSTVHIDDVKGVHQDIHVVKLSIPKDGNKQGYCLDGQHRLFAFDPKRAKQHLKVDPNSYELPVAAFFNQSNDFISDLFEMINTRQVPVNPNQIYTMGGYSKTLEQAAQRAHDVLELVDGKKGGPLFGLIQWRPQDKGLLVRAITLS